MGALVIGVYEPLLIAFLLVTGFSWLVIIVKRWSKGFRQQHLLYLGLTSAIAVGLFYGVHLERVARLQPVDSAFPVSVQILLLSLKVAAALWAVAWVVKRKRADLDLRALHRTGAALNTATFLGVIFTLV